MPDFRVADTAPEHQKLRAAGLAAAGLWALAGAYAMRELTDGWVPAYWVTTWPSGKRHAATLMKVGLWTAGERNGMPGYLFHDWQHYQRTAEQLAVDRTTAVTRRALHGDAALLAAVKRRDRDRCRYCGREVNWSDRRSPAGGTYDHVIPIPAGGVNTLDGVVVACRGCNVRKRSRTPAQAGMTLLPPPGDLLAGTDPEQNRTRTEPDLNQIGSGSVLRNPHPHPRNGRVGGDRPASNARNARNEAPPALPTSENRPPERCTQHRELDTDTDPGPCRGCMKAREHAQQWDKDTTRQRTVDVRACTWCDTEGWRIDPRHKHRGPLSPGVRCDHTAWSPEQSAEVAS
ncbi:MAG: HNH endonuclease [Pseudonocardiaceae bacterium]